MEKNFKFQGLEAALAMRGLSPAEKAVLAAAASKEDMMIRLKQWRHKNHVLTDEDSSLLRRFSVV